MHSAAYILSWSDVLHFSPHLLAFAMPGQRVVVDVAGGGSHPKGTRLFLQWY
jgi:hypothetical protein